MRLSFIFLILGYLPFFSAQAAGTPSHIFQVASSMELSLESLRAQEGVTEPVKQPSVQINKLPFHVYTKAVEVNQKIIRLQQKLGLPPSDAITLPVRKITPTDVFPVVAQLESNLKTVFERKNLPWQQAEFIANKTPSNSYEKLMSVSYALDTLVGAINPNLVYRNAQSIQADLQLIAKTLNKPIITTLPPQVANSKAYDVNIQAFKDLYAIAKLERQLGLKAVRIADFPIGNITPGEVYDTTNTLLAELVRIKVALNLTQPSPDFPIPPAKKAAEVRQLMANIGLQIKALQQ